MNQPLEDPYAGVENDGHDGAESTEFGSREGHVRHIDPRERLAQPGPIDDTELIELLCADQLHRWRGGERIPAEAYLSLHPTLQGNGEVAFELIYGEYLVRESLGESPKLEEFFWRFPAFAGRMRRQLELHQALEEAASGTETEFGEDVSERPIGGATVPVVPGYEILGILGQGGMSVVYLARQIALNRRVALKVIHAKVYNDPDIAARFRDEAEAAARLQHPNIIQVYEVGEYDGLGYLVLEYAPGGSLQQKLAGTPQKPRQAAETIEYLARALHYAHQHHIVHRDLKPANVVLSEDGIPKVTDFGLAKLLEREAGLTRTGDIMGTPSYMAPEQARGTPADVTAAADIYALGAILYEMLTGRPPFKGATPLSTLSQVAGQEPVAPGRLQRHLPREIETICLKCLEKEPRKRYDTALELAEDLRRFLDDRPILAPDRACRVALSLVPPRTRQGRPGRRPGGRADPRFRGSGRPVAAGAGEGLRRDPGARPGRGGAAQALDNLYLSRIAQSRLEWRLNNIPAARRLLDECEPGRRGWEWQHLRRLEQSELDTISWPEFTHINAVAFSRDGSLFAFAAYNAYENPKARGRFPVEVWELASRRRLGLFDGAGPTVRLSFDPLGRRLAASGSYGATLWDVSSGKAIHTWTGGGSLTFSPDGKALAACSNGRVTFWDPETGARIRDFPSTSGRVTYRPDGSVVAVSGPDAVELRDATTGREVGRLPHDSGEADERKVRMFTDEGPELAFSPDGRYLVAATNPPRVWDTNTGHTLYRFSGHDGSVPGVAFSPDGRFVATAGVDSTIRFWDMQTGSERDVFRGHSAWVGCLAYHPEGWSILSGGRHVAELKFWDLTRRQEYLTMPAVRGSAMAFEPDGKTLSLITVDGRLQRREIESGRIALGRHVEQNRRALSPATLAEFSADGRRLATVADDPRLIKLWDPKDGRELATFRGLSVNASYLALSPDALRVAASGITKSRPENPREVIVWDTGTAQVLATFHPSPAPTIFINGRVALDGAGSRVAFDDYEDAVVNPSTNVPMGNPRAFIKVCGLSGRREPLKLPMPGARVVFSLAFSPDGRFIAAGEQEGKVWIWDAQTGALVNESLWESESFRLAFSPDGRRLAGVNRLRVQVRNVEDGRDILILRGAPSRPFDGAFNPLLAWSGDGSQLASSNWDQTVSIWNGAEATTSVADRWASARERAFAWHLDGAESALAREQIAAADFHLDEIRAASPPDSTALRRRARLHLRLGHHDRASDDFARWLSLGEPDEGDGWVSYARLFLMRGDRQGYRNLCARMLESLEKDQHWAMARNTARAFGLATAPETESRRLLEVIRHLLDPRLLRPHDLSAVAMAEYRCGEYAAARATLQRSLRSVGSGPGALRPLMAMIQYHLGNIEQARHELDTARQGLTQHDARPGAAAAHLIDEEWFDYELLVREAEAMLRSIGK